MRPAGVDISSELQLHSVRAGSEAACCSGCKRRLLPGEILHVYDRHSVCALCVDTTRTPLRSERVHAAVRQLAVVPRAA